MIKIKDLVAEYGEYEIDEKELEKVLIKPKPNTVWHLKDGDCCYTMLEDGLIRLINFDEDAYFNVRELGMLASNEQELIDFREWLKIRAELLKLGGRERFNYNQPNFYIIYDHHEKEICFSCWSEVQHQSIWFDTEKQAKNAVQEIGEDRLKKYWFKVADDE